MAKLTEAKSFSRDGRARDLAGWPRAHALLVVATWADRRFTGLAPWMRAEWGGQGQAITPDEVPRQRADVRADASE